MSADQQLLEKVMTYAAEQGITGKSLREIAAGTGTSHRMLLYHFGSREGLMAAIVAAMEERQRALLSALSERAATPAELMLAQWQELSSPEIRPFVRLFFEVLGVAVQGAPGTQELLRNLTDPWLEINDKVDTRLLRIGVAVSRGLLLDLLAGADPKDVTAAYQMFVKNFEQWVSSADVA
jgi:AcrR family transcriptional regulator